MSTHETDIEWVDPSEAWGFDGDGPERKERLWDDEPSGADRYDRARDVAGTSPRHAPESLLPSSDDDTSSHLRPDVVDGTAIEEDAEGRTIGSSTLREGAAWGDPSGARTRHAGRFQFAKGALGALGLAAIVGAVALAAHQSDAKAPVDNWTAWKPNKKIDASIPLQIGAFLAPRYKLATGEQMVDVTGTDQLAIDGLQAGFAVRKSTKTGGEIFPIDATKTTVYDMCGFGTDCTIAVGKPTEERGLMVRREALELALYTFHYTKAKYAVVRLPPHSEEPTSAEVEDRINQGQSRSKANEAVTIKPALFFDRDSLKIALDRPLGAALTPTPPAVLDIKDAPDEANVLSLTQDAESQYDVIQNPQDGHPYVVLQLGGS